VEFSGESATVVELNRILTLSDEVLRYRFFAATNVRAPVSRRQA